MITGQSTPVFPGLGHDSTLKSGSRLLTFAFAVLITVNLAYIPLGFLSIPSYYHRVTTQTIQTENMPFANYPTNESVVNMAAAQGLTLEQYAVVQIVFHAVLVLVFIGVAAVILLRASSNWFAWYSAFFLVFIAGYIFNNEIYIARLLPLWIFDIGSLFWPFILPYFFLFPNGSPAPRWALRVVIPTFVLHSIFQTTGLFLLLFPQLFLQGFFENFLGFFQVGIILVFIFILSCQAYRYMRVSTPVEKQQTKWFLVGFGFFLLISVLSETLGEANPYRSEINLLIFAFIPMSLSIAILRFRLWDIDVIIRRTLQYALLTGLLSLVYFGGVALLSTLGGQTSPVVIVLTTLLIAAMFTPLRQRIQNFIDRRFYRQKYDAEKALAEFATAARSETDLEQLSDHLSVTVRDSLQPEHMSLWLKPAARQRSKQR